MNLLVKNNRLVGVEPLDGPANKNLLCVKGKFASYKFVGSGDRLTEPLIKRNGIFEPASWEEALTLVSSKFNEIKAENSPDTLAGFRALERQMKIIMSFKNGACCFWYQ